MNQNRLWFPPPLQSPQCWSTPWWFQEASPASAPHDMRKGWPPVPQTLRKWRRKSPWHCWTALPCPHGRSSHILLLTAASSPGGLVTGLCSCWTLKSSTTHGTCSPKGWVAAFSGHCLAATCFPEHPSLKCIAITRDLSSFSMVWEAPRDGVFLKQIQMPQHAYCLVYMEQCS